MSNDNNIENNDIIDIYLENQDDDLDNGLLPQIWGPPTWKALHCITFGYPNNPTKGDKARYKMFFKMIGYVLPCKSCRDSYINFIKNGDTKITSDVLKDRESLARWLYNVHQAVNKKIGINYNVKYEDIIKTYESYRAKCSKLDGKCLPANKENEDINKPYDIVKYFNEYNKKKCFNDLQIKKYKFVH